MRSTLFSRLRPTVLSAPVLRGVNRALLDIRLHNGDMIEFDNTKLLWIFAAMANTSISGVGVCVGFDFIDATWQIAVVLLWPVIGCVVHMNAKRQKSKRREFRDKFGVSRVICVSDFNSIPRALEYELGATSSSNISKRDKEEEAYERTVWYMMGHFKDTGI